LRSTHHFTLVVCAFFAIALGIARPSIARPPNIIFILADDLGYANIGCYGATQIQTPHIDRLAAEGMRFTQFYAGGAVCAPSRCVLMTGLHTGHSPIRANGGGNPLRDSDITLAEILKGAGYTTGGFGKWGLGTETSSGAAIKQGFDHFFGYLHQVHAHFYYPYWIWDDDRQFMLPQNEGGKRGAYSHDVILTHGLDFIRQNKERPFFCYMPFTLPHVELVVPDESSKPYRGRFPEHKLPDPRKGYIGADDAYATYAGMVSRLDDGVGKVAALVKELGLDDNTIILFSSDNGPQAGAWKDVVKFFNSAGPFRGAKSSLYEGGIRVPLIARWPGQIKPGVVQKETVAGFQDVLPTLAEIADAYAPQDIDGISFLASLRSQPQVKRHEFMYWEHYTDAKPARMIQAVRAADWKIVQGKPDAPFELYDLANDVAESRDVSAEHPDIVERLKAIASRAHTPPRNDPSNAKPVGVNDFVR
jgi:arylsulfatase A-like enzyme